MTLDSDPTFDEVIEEILSEPPVATLEENTPMQQPPSQSRSSDLRVAIADLSGDLKAGLSENRLHTAETVAPIREQVGNLSGRVSTLFWFIPTVVAVAGLIVAILIGILNLAAN